MPAENVGALSQKCSTETKQAIAFNVALNYAICEPRLETGFKTSKQTLKQFSPCYQDGFYFSSSFWVSEISLVQTMSHHGYALIRNWL